MKKEFVKPEIALIELDEMICADSTCDMHGMLCSLDGCALHGSCPED